MLNKPSRKDFVVSRLTTAGPWSEDSIRVLWVIFRGAKHVKGAAFATKYEAAATARKLAKKAGMGYWVERKSGGYDEGKP